MRGVLSGLIGSALLLGCACLAAPAAAESTEPRVALVIGNSAYGGEIGDLANPANDARLMAETLRKLGFTVIERIDADQKQMQRAVIDFGKSLSQAGSEATGLFYYAGHGLQVDGENYLIPVNASINDERDVEVEAVASNLVLKQMDFAGNAVNIVILDACRNNPLSRGFRSQVSGLAEPRRKPRGSFIAYSTAPGDVAADGASRNSPYTRALVDAMQQPGAALEEIFREVRSSVMAATRQKQVPWDSSSLTAPFYFIPPAEAAPAAPDAANAPPPAPAASGDAKAVELAYWNAIANSSNPAMFQNYLKKYPNGEFADLAAAKLDELNQPAAAAKSRAPETAPDGDPGAAMEIAELDATYVAVQGANIRAAPSTDAKIVARLKADDPVQVTGQVKGKDWYRVESESGSGFVNMTLLAPADAVEIAEWRDLKAAPDAEAVQAFLAKYPDGHLSAKAQALLAALQSPAAASPAPPAPAATAPAAAESSMKPGRVIRDCADCPEMVVVPSGSFVMGAANGETGTYTNEGPQRQVAIRAFAVAKYEVTIGDYATFLQQSGYENGAGCYIDTVNLAPGVGFRNPGFSGYAPGSRDAAVCIDWNAAQAYAGWLSKKTGKRYRLLTEAEFEYATRAGSTGFFPWGIDPNQACAYANIADAAAMAAPWWQAGYTGVSCNDGASYTSAVGRYQPNAFGLYDMIGNVAEWVADCYFDGYASAPTDGSAVDAPGCQQRALRGGSWGSNPYLSRSAARVYAGPSARVTVYGFRVARDL